jgi:hypothetical protein
VTTPTAKQLASLPQWAQRHIEKLESNVAEAARKTERIEEMLPWTKPDMDWFTIFRPPHRADREINIFTCDEAGTVRLCTLGRHDFLFVGRSKERDL